MHSPVSGTPLQYSCLENPMDGGAWWAAAHGVAKSWTRLSNFTFTHILQILPPNWDKLAQGLAYGKCSVNVCWMKKWMSTYLCLRAKSLQLCPILGDTMDCSPPGSSVQGILQARILEWVAVPSSKGSSWSRDRTHVSLYLPHWQAGSLPLGPPGKPYHCIVLHENNL